MAIVLLEVIVIEATLLNLVPLPNFRKQVTIDYKPLNVFG
jgi:hypothetical protein